MHSDSRCHTGKDRRLVFRRWYQQSRETIPYRVIGRRSEALEDFIWFTLRKRRSYMQLDAIVTEFVDVALVSEEKSKIYMNVYHRP